MTTPPGSLFPTITPQGELLWWVIPEGFLGKLVNALGPGVTLNLYTVKQSTTRPPGAVAGPFSTQAEAQAQATAMNTAGKNQATLPNIATGAASSAASTVTNDALKPIFQSGIWLRVVEVIAGLMLLGIGVNALFKGRPLQLVTGVAGAAGRVVP